MVICYVAEELLGYCKVIAEIKINMIHDMNCSQNPRIESKLGIDYLPSFDSILDGVCAVLVQYKDCDGYLIDPHELQESICLDSPNTPVGAAR